jgi:hypothetical protein
MSRTASSASRSSSYSTNAKPFFIDVYLTRPNFWNMSVYDFPRGHQNFGRHTQSKVQRDATPHSQPPTRPSALSRPTSDSSVSTSWHELPTLTSPTPNTDTSNHNRDDDDATRVRFFRRNDCFQADERNGSCQTTASALQQQQQQQEQASNQRAERPPTNARSSVSSHQISLLSTLR